MSNSGQNIENLSIYLINLDRSQQRLEKASVAFRQYGLAFEKFSAVDGQKLPDDYIRHVHEHQSWVLPLSPNEIGCYKSHMDVLKYFLEKSDTEYAFIAEDDFSFAEGFIEKIKAVIQHWPKGYDMLKMHTLTFGEKVKTIETSAGSVTMYDPVKVSAGTFCHLVNREGAKKILQNMAFKRPIDIDLQTRWQHHLNILITSDIPVFAAPWSMGSDIGVREKKPVIPHTLYKLWFYMHNFMERKKKWGLTKTLSYLYAYRKEKLRRQFKK